MRHISSLLIFCFLLVNGLLTAQDTDQVYPFAFQERWGLVDQDRQIRFPATLDSIGLFTNLSEDAMSKKIAVAFNNGRMGVLNQEGKWLLKSKVDSVGRWQYYAPGLRWVNHKGRFGLMDFNGKKAKWLIKPRYTSVDEFRGRKLVLSVVAIDDRWGVINSEGKVVVGCEYDAVKLLDDYSDYPDIKLTKNDVVSYVDAFGAARPTEEMQRQEEMEMWDDEVVFEDVSMEEEPSRHRINRQQATGGMQVVVLEQSTAGRAYQAVEQRSIPAAFTIQDVKINERYGPLRINTVVVKRDGKIGFWGKEELQAPGTIFDKLMWKRSGRYGELAYVWQGEKLGLVSENGKQILPASFSSIEEYGTLFRLTHPDGYRGFADSKGVVFLPEAAKIAE